MDFTNEELAEFLEEASRNCYLGEFKKSEVIERPGFFEMDYSRDDWSYRDSFIGFYTSAGQEVIKHKGKIVWVVSYGGGVTEKYINNESFFREVESFLRKSLALKDSSEKFHPRGPESFEDGDWKYECNWTGGIDNFKGLEEILYKDEKVFYHNFFGSIIHGLNK